MSTDFSVQKGVLLPEINRTPKGTKSKYPINTMSVGDMFFVPGRSSKSVGAYISRISKDVPGKFSARRCFMWLAPDDTWQMIPPGEETQVAGATEGAGVWRIE